MAGHRVSSLGVEKRFGGDPGPIAAANPGLTWCNTSRRGHLVVDLMPDAATGEWLFLPSRDERSTRLLDSVKRVTERSSARLLAA
jgi:alkaline phosphatase D